MHPPGADVVLVRHGEIGVKSDQVRRKMETRLAENLEALLGDRSIDGQVERRRNRLYVHTDDLAAGTDAATDCFGVASASPAVRVEPTIEAVSGALVGATGAHYDGGSFAVDARRAGATDAHPFSSEDLGREGGSAVWETIEGMGGDPVVDLDDPDFELFVECRADDAYVFLDQPAGPGGLPLRTQSPLVALISGGIDSPVAAWEAMRRGSPIVPVYVDLGAQGGPDHRARAITTVERLAEYAPNVDMAARVVPAGDLVGDLVGSMDDERMLALRRCMVAIGEAIAREVGAVGVLTGEAIGQKSSQTAANLAVTDAAVELPVHRPNLTLDKPEIVATARAIDTYHDSTIPAGCNRVAPSFPETNADLADVEAAEPDGLLDRARALASDAEIVSLEQDT